jgi:hypothetical protein
MSQILLAQALCHLPPWLIFDVRQNMKPKKQRLIRAARIERHVLLGVLAASLAVPYAIYGMLYRGADIPQFLEWILFPGWVLNHFTTGDDMMKYPSAVSRFSVIFWQRAFPVRRWACECVDISIYTQK